MKHTGRSESVETILQTIAHLIHRSRMTSYPHLGERLFKASMTTDARDDPGFYIITFESHGLAFGYDVQQGGKMYTAYLLIPEQEQLQVYYAHQPCWWLDGPHWQYMLSTFIPWFTDILRQNGQVIQNARTPQEEAEDQALQNRMAAWFKARGSTPPTSSDGPFSSDLADDWAAVKRVKGR